MKKFCILIFATIFVNVSYAQVHYKSNDTKTEMYYENILNFKGKSKKDLHDLVMKYLAVNNYTIQYNDDNEIYATGKFETRYRGRFLVFMSTNEFNCLYDLKFNFKDEKIKYLATNYMLLSKNIKVNSYSWFSNPSSIGSSAWSTTKIPTEVPKKPVNVHYKAGKTSKFHLLFQDLDAKMSLFEIGLIKMLESTNDNW